MRLTFCPNQLDRAVKCSGRLTRWPPRSTSSALGLRLPPAAWLWRRPPTRTPPCTPRPTCWSTGPTRCWPPTPTDVARAERRRHHGRRVVDRLRLTPARDRGHGRRPAPGGRPCPTRWARSSTAGAGPTACGSAGSGCRSASSASSTRTGPTSPATPPACASSRATPRFLRGSSARHQLQPGHRRHPPRGRWPRPACPRTR